MNQAKTGKQTREGEVRRVVNQWDFAGRLKHEGFGPLNGVPITTLQINVGKLCNQACHHCHVEAGPKRTERMTARTADRLVELIDSTNTVQVVDITGGAPELNANFRPLVRAARARGIHVIDRCNLTVLFEPGQEDTAQFLADHSVEVVASLPCYSLENVDKQRGHGVFDKSIRALQQLNALGYGDADGPLVLNLVYNPLGAFLPPPQGSLEQAYKDKLKEHFGIRFNQLFTITNMPIKRFAEQLVRNGEVEGYMNLLVNSFNPTTVDGMMCRSQISIGWDGSVFDCDFNQMLEIPLADDGLCSRPTIFDVQSLADLASRPIATEGHCFGCTAGAGSSCGGALQ